MQSRSSAGLELSKTDQLEAKVESLETYVQSLERRLQSSPPPLRLDPQITELTSLRQTVTTLSQENESLRCKLESVSLSLSLAEQRIAAHSGCQRRISELEGIVTRLRQEISIANVRKSDFSPEQSYSMPNQPDIIPSRQEETFQRVKSSSIPAKDQEVEQDYLSSQLLAFMRESEEKQKELKRRIAVLESRKRARKKSSPRKSHSRDLSEPRSRSGECERCARRHSKETSRHL